MDHTRTFLSKHAERKQRSSAGWKWTPVTKSGWWKTDRGEERDICHRRTVRSMDAESRKWLGDQARSMMSPT